MRVLTVLTLVLFLLSPIAMAAKVYKWVDGDGKIHYSDTPQVKQEAQVVVAAGVVAESPATANSFSDSSGEQVALCKKAANNMRRFLPQIEKLAREGMKSDPNASQQEFDKAMKELSALKRVPTAKVQASCVSDYESDAQARTFANCFGNANDVMEASICMAFSG